MRWAGHVARIGNGSGSYSFVETSDGKRPLGRPRHVWEYNIKMELQEMRWGFMGWIVLTENRDRCRVLVNAVMNLLVP